MTAPIVVHRPSPCGGRYVTVRGEICGLARGMSELRACLRSAGLDLDPAAVQDSSILEWRDGPPNVWELPSG